MHSGQCKTPVLFVLTELPELESCVSPTSGFHNKISISCQLTLVSDALWCVDNLPSEWKECSAVCCWPSLKFMPSKHECCLPYHTENLMRSALCSVQSQKWWGFGIDSWNCVNLSLKKVTTDSIKGLSKNASVWMRTNIQQRSAAPHWSSRLIWRSFVHTSLVSCFCFVLFF